MAYEGPHPLPVPSGGTGDTSVTAFAPICGGTTTTAAFQSASTGIGTSGFVLTSTGSSSLPSFQTVSASGAITTITGNSGGAESPSSGNFNILGTGSITIAGTANTETVQLTGLTNHNLLVGAGTATITKIAPSATSGVPVISQGASSDPTFGTAVVAGGGTGQTTLTNHAVLVGAGTSAITQVGPSSTTGAVFIGAGSSADPAYSTTTTVTDSTGNLTISSSQSGGTNGVLVNNTSNTSSSNAYVTINTAGTSAGKSIVQFSNTTDTVYSISKASTTNASLVFSAGNPGTNDNLTLDSSGRMTNALQPAFTAFLSSTASSVTGDGTAYTIVFDSTNFNVGTMYNTGTGVATIPRAGKYLITAQCLITSIGAAHTGCTFDIVSTSGTYTTAVIFHGSELNPATCRDLTINANDLILQAHGLINFAANDTFKVVVTVSGSTKTIGVFGTASPNFYTMFSAVLLC